MGGHSIVHNIASGVRRSIAKLQKMYETTMKPHVVSPKLEMKQKRCKGYKYAHDFLNDARNAERFLWGLCLGFRV